MDTNASTAHPVRKPNITLPAGACDSHFHIMGPASRFPIAPNLKHTPADATREMLYELHRRLGISRGVIVHTAAHGLDNSVTEDGIRMGEGRYVGIALVPTNVADAELARLARAGFRGVRFNFMRHLTLSAPIEEVIALTPRLAQHGLHLQVHFESKLVHEIGPWLLRSAVPVVIDHIGRVDALLGPEHADFAALHALLRDERLALKVSGVDRIDRAWPYAAGVALARIMVESYPDRCVWGTDWPHPNHHHQPDDTTLVELLPEIATTASRLQALMVDNPARIYGFAA
jgi:2-pyrone-4,6-dicarboxylate lactonase